ncbi:MAG TPA: hypothetical protein VG389_13415 [Myxococcota bacterium]|jgi:hypothetical protein|nr:hypothetical protein [Myxococcota bacterium]
MWRWKVPEPIPIDWPMRDVSSAKIAVRELDDGRQQRVIEHAPLPGMKPAMMVWFLKNIDRTDMAWRGHRLLAYRYWHVRDHIHFEIRGTPGPGCRFHIVEAFQADPRYLLDVVFDVPKLDETGFRLEMRRLGTVVVAMDEEYADAPEGMRYKVTMTVGTTAPILGAVVRFARRLAVDRTLDAWHRHNVEEVGNLPHFLPELYAAYAGTARGAAPARP